MLCFTFCLTFFLRHYLPIKFVSLKVLCIDNFKNTKLALILFFSTFFYMRLFIYILNTRVTRWKTLECIAILPFEEIKLFVPDKIQITIYWCIGTILVFPKNLCCGYSRQHVSILITGMKYTCTIFLTSIKCTGTLFLNSKYMYNEPYWYTVYMYNGPYWYKVYMYNGPYWYKVYIYNGPYRYMYNGPYQNKGTCTMVPTGIKCTCTKVLTSIKCTCTMVLKYTCKIFLNT